MLAAAARAASRRVSSSASCRGLQTAALPDLPYDYGALEPVISGEIMQLHHAKHHAAYVAGLNAAAVKYAAAEAKGDVQAMVALQPALKFNGGGHINHSLFWQNLCPPGEAAPPSGPLVAAIEAEFGSVANLQSRLSAAGAGIQGSGWAWLGWDAASSRLALGTTSNQDPAVTIGLHPLLGIDCWEHAYYLQYKNVRPDYLKRVWDVVNWKDVGARYEAAAGKAK